MSDLKIAIFDNADDVILQLDFSWLNVRVLKLSDPEFNRFIESISHKSEGHDWTEDNLDVFAEMKSNEYGAHPYLFAFLPIDITKPVDERTFHSIEEMLLIMFPSDFKLTHVVDFDQGDDGKFMGGGWRSYEGATLGWYGPENARRNDYFLKFSMNNDLNTFFKVGFERIPKLDYLVRASRSYISSFSQQVAEMRYLNLCIALESLTDAQTEVTHRICRTCAVLNAATVEDGDTIYHNANQFYKLRSLIVHGGVAKKGVAPYLFNLQALVSRTLIEVISLNIEDFQELTYKIVQSGFGDKAKFREEYIHANPDEGISKLVKTKVAKY
jgi:hypothetical protein